MSQLPSLDIPLSGLVEVRRRLVNSGTGEARRGLFGGIPIASTSQTRRGRGPSGVALGLFRLSSQLVASLNDATKPVHPRGGGLGSIIRVGVGVCRRGVIVVMRLRVPVSHTESLPTRGHAIIQQMAPTTFALTWFPLFVCARPDAGSLSSVAADCRWRSDSARTEGILGLMHTEMCRVSDECSRCRVSSRVSGMQRSRWKNWTACRKWTWARAGAERRPSPKSGSASKPYPL